MNARAYVKSRKRPGIGKKVWKFLAKGVDFLGKVVEFWRCGVR